MKLSHRRRRILNAVRGRASATIPELAAHLGLQSTSVRYELKKLQEQGVLVDRSPLIDVRRLGFEVYNLYLGVHYSSSGARQRLFEVVNQHPLVVWFSEIGGSYQLSILVQVCGPRQIFDLVKHILHTEGVSVTSKLVSRNLGFSIFPWDKADLSDIVHASGERDVANASVDVDSTALRVLRMLAVKDSPSNREIARLSGLGNATVDRAVGRLQQAGILVGYFWRVDYSKSGLTKYKLLITSKSHSPSFRSELLEFGAQSDGVTHLSECLGAWDFELSVEVDSPAEAARFSEEFRRQFGDRLSHVESIPVFGFGEFRPVSQEFYHFLERQR